MRWNPNGPVKNLLVILEDVRAIRAALREDHLEQDGWTHAYMQFWRTACLAGPRAIAHLCGIGGPILALIAIGQGIALWWLTLPPGAPWWWPR